MKQNKIIKETYKACVTHDRVREKSLFFEELYKIFKRKNSGKSMSSTKWTVLR